MNPLLNNMKTVNSTNTNNNECMQFINEENVFNRKDNGSTLEELFDAQLKQLPFNENVYHNVSDFITDDNKSADFLNSFYYNEKLFPKQDNDSTITKGRARHSAISFLLGLCIGDFCKLFGNCSAIFNDMQCDYMHINEPYINYKLWMCTATNHDYGYYSELVKQQKALNELAIKYDLFDDTLDWNENILKCFEQQYPKVLKNSYQNIKDYYIYSQIYHLKENSDEKSDHGILGGVLLYDRFLRKHCKNIKNIDASTLSFSGILNKLSYRDVLYYKASCLTICQHNIFKSNNSNSDLLYGNKLSHLFHNGGYFIGRNHPLLLLLSLVDTIECVKRFSRKESASNYFQTLTILKSIRLSVNKQKIVVDFTDLANKIYHAKNESKLLQELNKHVNAIIEMQDWACLNVKQTKKWEVDTPENKGGYKLIKENYMLTITYKEKNDIKIKSANDSTYQNCLKKQFASDPQ